MTHERCINTKTDLPWKGDARNSNLTNLVATGSGPEPRFVQKPGPRFVVVGKIGGSRTMTSWVDVFPILLIIPDNPDEALDVDPIPGVQVCKFLFGLGDQIEERRIDLVGELCLIN